MSNTQFTFFPVVRQGYRPDSSFSKGTASLSNGGLTDVTLNVKATGPAGSKSTEAGVDLSIYGPGEVTGLDTDQVVRMEPEPETTAFPPNYFPLVEFDSPQLPWLFSPTQADGAGRNRPWLCLVAVEVQQSSYKPAGTGPMPVLETKTSQLPDLSESWAWAHAQLVGDHDPESEFSSSSTRTVSRLVCPRNLEPKTKYRACIVPVYEPGRKAGLGLDPYPNETSDIDLAWTDEKSIRLPVYHSWVFTSATRGDFESLARELDPTEFGPSIGFRDIDVSNPGPETLKLPYDELSETGTVGIGGALKSIGATADGYDADATSDLREMLNKPQEVLETTDYGAVGPPLYGQWHAGVPELEPESMDTDLYYYPRWFNTLNTDPRHRIAAGYGTQVIQDHQERLMAEAWTQFGDIQEANRYLRRLQLAEQIMSRRHAAIESYSTGTLLGFSSPVHGHLLDDIEQQTIHATSIASDLPTPLSSTAFRRVTRATGPIARRPGNEIETSNLATRLETGRLPRLTDGLDFTIEGQPQTGTDSVDSVETPALEGLGPAETMDIEARTAIDTDSGGKQSVTDIPEVRGQAGSDPEALFPASGDLPSLPREEADRDPDIQQALTALDSLDTHVSTADRSVRSLSNALGQDDDESIERLLNEQPTLADHCEAIARNTFGSLSRSVAKTLTEPRPASLSPAFDQATANQRLRALHQAQRQLEDAVETAIELYRAGDPPAVVRRRLDRAEQALRRMQQTSDSLRSSLSPSPMQLRAMSMSSEDSLGEFDRDSLTSLGASSPVDIDLPSKESLRTSIISGLDPSRGLHELAAERLGIPNLPSREDPVESVLAAPKFTDFTYRLLAQLNQEYFLPGVSQIPKSSIGVLQTNPVFIEAFMSGLNHEFSRELQWRRYPTDRKGTYFRRFWNRKGTPAVDSSNPEAMADIEPMHTWDENELGENSPRDGQAKVVLLIKGELLRRYPNTDIFVAKAVEDEGDRLPALPDTHISRDDGGEDIKFPVFRGKLDPDITFFGFDLTPEEALYDPYHESGQPEPDDHADEGWFFVLQEPPAETRFGMDVGASEDIGETPAGFTTGGSTEQLTEDDLRGTGAEHGWSALSWAHLVEEGTKPTDVNYVDVDGSRPGTEGWKVESGTTYVSDGDEGAYSYDAGDAAEWGYNSAHMARATWQRPVRISIHADDMIPEEPPNDTDWRNVQLDIPATMVYTGGDQ